MLEIKVRIMITVQGMPQLCPLNLQPVLQAQRSTALERKNPSARSHDNPNKAHTRSKALNPSLTAGKIIDRFPYQPCSPKMPKTLQVSDSQTSKTD